MQIRILRAVLVEGAHVDEGALLGVPADITPENADQLVRYGCAERVADAEPAGDDLAEQSVAELKAIAAAEGVALPERAKKGEIVAAIAAARAAGGITLEPAPGVLNPTGGTVG